MWREVSHTCILCAVALIGAGVTAVAETPNSASSSANVDPVNNISLPPIYIERTLAIKPNSALTSTLTKAGVGAKLAHKITAPLKRKVALNKLRAGSKIVLTYKIEKTTPPILLSINFSAPNDKTAKVSLQNGKYVAEVKKIPLTTVKSVAIGIIEGSLYQSAAKAGMPAALVPSFANLFAYELDFTRDIRKGNAFKVVFEKVQDENGNYVRSGKILAAELYARGKTRTAFRYKDSHGVTTYYDAKGIPKKRLLLRTPLEFTRISSNFNPKRRHPVLGYTRAHKGTDFAAPRGTPVKAAGNGTIEVAKRWGSFGNYIRIKHNGKYKTAYAHLKGFARGIRAGKRVAQGQVIGYVGTTGRSTGPHLHYEVTVNNRKVNAMRAKLPTGNPLPKRKRNAFKQMVASIEKLWNADVLVASR